MHMQKMTKEGRVALIIGLLSIASLVQAGKVANPPRITGT
jgi:hypothetical protein